ncbi:MAG: hypothetical protein C0485_01835 [Pirellula sp.]|nr:hypothetical protein [Pirellula sp.]
MPKYLKQAQVQRLLSLSERSIRRLVASGTLPAPVKLGGANRWNEDELNEYLRKLDPKNNGALGE